MKKILITGATGFVGSNLVKYLVEKGFEIEIIDLRKDWQSTFPKDYYGIVHLAGKAHDIKHVSSPDDYYTINTDLTKELYKNFINTNGEKFIFISSVKAVADEVSTILTEDIIPDPITHYGKSKLLAEEFLNNNSQVERKKTYILRPCMIHGPGNKGNLSLLYNFVRKGIPYPLGAFKNERSFLSVENLCFVISEILEQENFMMGTYNVADATPLSTKQVVEILASSLGKQPKILNISPIAIKLMAKVGGILKLPLNSDRLGKLTENYVVSSQKLIEVLKKPLPVDSKTGLKKTGDSFSL